MIGVRLRPGIKSIDANAKKLMKAGMSKQEAYDYAYKFARRMSDRRFESIHKQGRFEQRAR